MRPSSSGCAASSAVARRRRRGHQHRPRLPAGGALHDPRADRAREGRRAAWRGLRLAYALSGPRTSGRPPRGRRDRAPGGPPHQCLARVHRRRDRAGPRRRPPGRRLRLRLVRLPGGLEHAAGEHAAGGPGRRHRRRHGAPPATPRRAPGSRGSPRNTSSRPTPAAPASTSPTRRPASTSAGRIRRSPSSAVARSAKPPSTCSRKRRPTSSWCSSAG